MSSSSSSSGSSSSGSSSSSKAQVGAEEDFDHTAVLAQINAEIEAETGAETEAYALLETELSKHAGDTETFFTNFLAQIGVEDTETLLAELNSELSADEVMALATDPDTYMSLMQLATEMDTVPETANVGDMMAQTAAYKEEDFGDVAELLGQLDASELDKLTGMLQGVNEGLTLAQAETEMEGTDNQEVLD